MRHRSTTRRRAAALSVVALLLVAATLAIIGCSSDDNPVSPGGGTPTSTSFSGFITDGFQSGKLTVLVNTTSLAKSLHAANLRGATVTASGTISIGSATTPLTGTYDPDADSLKLDGGGWSLRGETDFGGAGPSIAGGCTSSNGPGVFASGNFGSTSILVYSGMYYNAAFNDSGTWNMATYADTVFIVAYAPGASEPIVAQGLLSGSAPTRNIVAHGGDIATYEMDVTGTLGTVTGLAVGTWGYVAHDPGYGTDDNGTWNGEIVP